MVLFAPCLNLASQEKARSSTPAMADGVASLASVFYPMAHSGMHTDEIGANLFDGGAPFYAIYECADGRYMSVAPIEPHFWSLLLSLIGVDEADLPAQYDRGWVAWRESAPS